MKRIILLNIVCFLLLMILFLVAALGMGYAAGNRFGTDAGILFILVVVIHLFLNYLIMHRQKDIRPRKIWVATAVILCIYLLLLFH